MTEEITVEQALKKLDQIAEEWVAKDLEKGIPIAFRYWRGGRKKELLSLMLWRSVLVPCIFGLVVFTCAMMKAWKIFAILLGCYVFYWVIGALMSRRKTGNFIIRNDGITITTSKDKTYIPWEAVTEISSTLEERVTATEQKGTHQSKTKYGNAYELIIQTPNECYSFYEVYVGALAKDPNGQVNPALMPLHVAYKVIKAAHKKVTYEI